MQEEEAINVMSADEDIDHDQDDYIINDKQNDDFIERDFQDKDLEIEDDNIENRIDYEFHETDFTYLEKQLLFSVQNLGGIRLFNGETVYMKGQHAIQAIKDIIKKIRKDQADQQYIRILLGNWKVLQNDLIQLLITQPQDKQLTFFVVILLVQLTEFPDQNMKSQKDKIIQQLMVYIIYYISPQLQQQTQEMKLQFLEPNVIKTLTNHLADCQDSIQKKSSNKAHERMIALLFTLFRNLVKIPDLQESQTGAVSNEHLRVMQQKLLHIFSNDSVFDALIYFCQDIDSNETTKSLLPIFLEIFYYILSSFEAKWLTSLPQDDYLAIQKVIEKETSLKQNMLNNAPSRHSRFTAKFSIVRSVDQTSKVLQNIKQLQNQEVDNLASQRKKPQRRKLANKFDLIYNKQLNQEGIIQKQQENLRQFESNQLKEIMLQFCKDFCKVAFNPFIQSLSDYVHKNSNSLEDDFYVQYFVLLAFMMNFTRQLFYRKKRLFVMNINRKTQANLVLTEKDKKQPTIKINHIFNAIQIAKFDTIYSHMLREATKEKKTNFLIRNFHAACVAFLEFLYIIKEFTISTHMQDRKNSQILMQYIFRHDITRLLRKGFQYCYPGVLQDQLLKTLIELIMVFFDLLEVYSKGKLLTIRTDRLLKRKKVASKKKRKKDSFEENDFIDNSQQDKLENENEEYIPHDSQQLKQEPFSNEQQEQRIEKNEVVNVENSQKNSIHPDYNQNTGSQQQQNEEQQQIEEHFEQQQQQVEEHVEQEKLDRNDKDDSKNDESKELENEEQLKNLVENEEGIIESERNEDFQEEIRYQERQFNIASEFAILAEYLIISRIFDLMKENGLLKNTDQINQGIYKYMKRLCDLLNAEWIFYQFDYMNLFHKVINNKEITSQVKFQPLISLIKQILNGFFALLNKNKLLMIEMLFRFTEKKIKDQILNNYEDLEQERAAGLDLEYQKQNGEAAQQN